LPNNRQYEVIPLKSFKHPDGVYLMVYSTHQALGGFCPDELVVILELPAGRHPDMDVLIM
jgi:hypothetical protein